MGYTLVVWEKLFLFLIVVLPPFLSLFSFYLSSEDFLIAASQVSSVTSSKLPFNNNKDCNFVC